MEGPKEVIIVGKGSFKLSSQLSRRFGDTYVFCVGIKPTSKTYLVLFLADIENEEKYLKRAGSYRFYFGVKTLVIGITNETEASLLEKASSFIEAI